MIATLLLSLALAGAANDPGPGKGPDATDLARWLETERASQPTVQCKMTIKKGKFVCVKPDGEPWRAPIVKPQGCGSSSACGWNNFPRLGGDKPDVGTTSHSPQR